MILWIILNNIFQRFMVMDVVRSDLNDFYDIIKFSMVITKTKLE
jgi:hypothetical protein